MWNFLDDQVLYEHGKALLQYLQRKRYNGHRQFFEDPLPSFFRNNHIRAKEGEVIFIPMGTIP